MNNKETDDQQLLQTNSPEKAFSEDGFWQKLNTYARSAGSEVVELALKLYYTMRDPDTPDSAKAIIIGSLAYFIIPIDAVADLLPGGYVDDWGALMGALWTVSRHIKQEHADKAKQKLADWFGDEALTDEAQANKSGEEK